MTNWKDIDQDFTPELQLEWEQRGFSYEQTKEWIDLGLKLKDADFADYLTSQNYTCERCLNNANIEELKKEYLRNSKDKNILVLNKAQEWIDLYYPKEARKNEKNLDISGSVLNRLRPFNWLKLFDTRHIKLLSLVTNKGLEGALLIEDFPNLEWLDCSHNSINKITLSELPKLNNFYSYSCELTDVVISNCPKISDFSADNNFLKSLSFLDSLDVSNLKTLNLNNNDFESQDLTIFSKFTNLEKLYLGTTDEWWPWRENIYNRFFGSLEHLKGLTKLKVLSIEATDIDSGWGQLVSIERFYCGSHREEAKCLKIARRLGEKYSKKSPYNIYSPFVHGFVSTFWNLQARMKEHSEEIRLIRENEELIKENKNLEEQLRQISQTKQKKTRNQEVQTDIQKAEIDNQVTLQTQQIQLLPNKQ